MYRCVAVRMRKVVVGERDVELRRRMSDVLVDAADQEGAVWIVDI